MTIVMVTVRRATVPHDKALQGESGDLQQKSSVSFTNAGQEETLGIIVGLQAKGKPSA